MESSKASPLEELIEKDFLTALKSKRDEILVSVLRLLKTAVKNAEINKKEKLTVEEIQKVIASEVKKRKDSIESYQKGQREDLAAKEQQELEILEKYLPQQLNEEELRVLVQKVIAEGGSVTTKDFGKIIGQVMARAGGRAEGGMVSRLVKEKLGG